MAQPPPIEHRYSHPPQPRNGNGRVSTGALTMDLTKVAAIVIGVGAATFTIAQTYFQVESQIHSLEGKINQLSVAVDKLDSRIVGKTPEGYHRRDAAENNEALCRSLATAIGRPVECPDPYSLPGFRARQRARN